VKISIESEDFHEAYEISNFLRKFTTTKNSRHYNLLAAVAQSLYLFIYLFNVCHPAVFNTYINIQRCVSHTQQNFIMFITVLGQHVSILTESSSGPSKIQILT